MEIRNTRSYEVEFDGHIVGPGEVLEVADEKLAKRLLEQEDNWSAQPAKKASSTTRKES